MFEREYEMLAEIKKTLKRNEKEMGKLKAAIELKDSYETKLREKQDEIIKLRNLINRLEFENQRLIEDNRSIWL